MRVVKKKKKITFFDSRYVRPYTFFRYQQPHQQQHRAAGAPVQSKQIITEPAPEAFELKPGSPPEIGYAPSPGARGSAGFAESNGAARQRTGGDGYGTLERKAEAMRLQRVDEMRKRFERKSPLAPGPESSGAAVPSPSRSYASAVQGTTRPCSARSPFMLRRWHDSVGRGRRDLSRDLRGPFGGFFFVFENSPFGVQTVMFPKHVLHSVLYGVMDATERFPETQIHFPCYDFKHGVLCCYRFSKM